MNFDQCVMKTIASGFIECDTKNHDPAVHDLNSVVHASSSFHTGVATTHPPTTQQNDDDDGGSDGHGSGPTTRENVPEHEPHQNSEGVPHRTDRVDHAGNERGDTTSAYTCVRTM